MFFSAPHAVLSRFSKYFILITNGPFHPITACDFCISCSFVGCANAMTAATNIISNQPFMRFHFGEDVVLGKSHLCEGLEKCCLWGMEVEWSTEDEFGLKEVERMSAIPRWWGIFMASSRSWGPSQQPWGRRRAGDTGGQWGRAAQSDPTHTHTHNTTMDGRVVVVESHYTQTGKSKHLKTQTRQLIMKLFSNNQ